MDREQLAREHFEWFRQYASRRYGDMGEEYAGVAFMKLCDAYKEEKGAFRTFAMSAATFFFLNNQRQSENGKDTSTRGVGRQHQLSIDAEDTFSAAEELEDCRGVTVDLPDVLRHLSEVAPDPLSHAASVCQVLGLFDADDTALILGRRSLRGVAIPA